MHYKPSLSLRLHAAGLASARSVRRMEAGLVQTRVNHEVVLRLLVLTTDAHLVALERILVLLAERCVVHVEAAARRHGLLAERVRYEWTKLVAVLRSRHGAALEGLQPLSSHAVAERSLLHVELGRELA